MNARKQQQNNQDFNIQIIYYTSRSFNVYIHVSQSHESAELSAYATKLPIKSETDLQSSNPCGVLFVFFFLQSHHLFNASTVEKTVICY